jgi:uncharacterized protein (TIGR04255 family)
MTVPIRRPDMIESVKMLGATAGRPAMNAAELSPFPESQRAIYRKNPLVEVVCQLRFPAVLRVDVEPPAGFQSRIRAEYPVLNDKSNELLGLPPETPTIVANLLRTRGGKQPQAAYDFVSADGHWTLSLTREFLALTTNEYSRWEEFKQHLEGPMAALLQEYSPPWFTRIGLRYQDLVRRSVLKLEDRAWSDLLKPSIVGLLASSDLNLSVLQSFTQTVMRLPGATNLTLRHGIAQASDNNELCYLIDNDFSVDERTSPTNVFATLDHFNQQSGRLFRWCITPELHSAMEPQLVPDPSDARNP